MTLAAIEQFPDDCRAVLVEPRFSSKFLDAIELGLEKCDRTAMTIYASAMKLLGEDRNLSVQIVNLIGAQPSAARAAIETVSSVTAMSEREKAEQAVAKLREMGWKCEAPEGWSSAEVEG